MNPPHASGLARGFIEANGVGFRPRIDEWGVGWTARPPHDRSGVVSEHAKTLAIQPPGIANAAPLHVLSAANPLLLCRASDSIRRLAHLALRGARAGRIPPAGEAETPFIGRGKWSLDFWMPRVTRRGTRRRRCRQHVERERAPCQPYGIVAFTEMSP